jgi:hypothetical protein
MQGRTEGNKVVTFEGPESLVGEIIPVRLVSTTGSTFGGVRADGAAVQRVA